MATDPDMRRQLAKQGRLWLLSLICATVGAVTVWRTNNLLIGIFAFLISLVVLGPILFAYEKRRK